MKHTLFPLLASLTLLIFQPMDDACADGAVLSTHDIVRIVINNHPLLIATEEEIRISKAELLGAKGAFDPVLRAESNTFLQGGYSGAYQNIMVEKPLEVMGTKLFAGYRKSGGEFPVYDDYFNTNTGGEMRAGIEIPLLRDGVIDRRRAAIARAAIQIEVSELSLQQRQLEVARQALLSYWNWVSAHHKKLAYETLLKKAEERVRQLAERVKSGDLAELEKVDNDRLVLQRKSQLTSAERSLTQAQYDLGLFLWDESNNPITLDTKAIPQILVKPKLLRNNQEQAVKEALEKRIEHRRLNSQIEQQKVDISLADNQLLPRLDIASYAANDYGSGSSDRAESDLRTLVRLEIPLLTRTQRGKIEELEAKQRALVAQLDFMKQKIRVEVLDAYNALLLALERAALASQEVSVSQKLEKGELQRYLQGESNLIFVNLREQSTVDARIREIDALADSWKGHVAFQVAQGLLLES